MNTNPLISVVLPVYNRHEYLSLAVKSVLEQSYPNWELIIADDGSDSSTQDLLRDLANDPRIKLYFNPSNLGLFRNLNQAICRSNGEYIVLLCSDDFLLPDCLKTGLDLLQQYKTEFLLSAFKVVGGDGQERLSASMLYYDLFMEQPLQVSEPESSLKLLLKYGSINGNLSGMFFTRNLYNLAGGFRESSCQTADWEWVYEAARHHPILLSKIPIAIVRFHEKQLSGVNFGNLRNSLEVAETVQKLLNDPYLKQLPESKQWAQYTMHHHLWYGLKLALKGDITKFLTLARTVHQTTGLWGTFSALLRNFPRRWNAYQNKTYMLPPY